MRKTNIAPMNHHPTIPIIAALILVFAVLMSGIHSKDLVTPLTQGDGQKPDDTHAKLTPELHHHSDNSVKIHQASDGHQADSRSLRLLNRKPYPYHQRLSERLRLWLEHNLHVA